MKNEKSPTEVDIDRVTDFLLNVIGHGNAITLQKKQLPREHFREVIDVLMRGNAVKLDGRDFLTCRICGRTFETMGRHLRDTHELSRAEYIEQYALPRNYKFVPRKYSVKRREILETSGCLTSPETNAKRAATLRLRAELNDPLIFQMIPKASENTRFSRRRS